MATLSIPYTFSPSTIAVSAQVDANFTAISTWSSNIDNTNIGAAGLFASQLIPTSAGQATFGGAVPFTFPVTLQLTGATAATFGLGDLAIGVAASSRANAIQIGNGFTAGFSTLGTSGSAGGVNGSVLTVSNTASGSLTNKAAVDSSGNLGLAGALFVGGAASNGGGGTISIGATTSASASAGATQAVPATVLGYIVGNINGTTIKIPYFSA